MPKRFHSSLFNLPLTTHHSPQKHTRNSVTIRVAPVGAGPWLADDQSRDLNNEFWLVPTLQQKHTRSSVMIHVAQVGAGVQDHPTASSVRPWPSRDNVWIPAALKRFVFTHVGSKSSLTIISARFISIFWIFVHFSTTKHLPLTA